MGASTGRSDAAALSTVVAAQSVQDLPLNGRNALTAMNLFFGNIDAVRGSIGFRLAAVGPLEIHDFGGLRDKRLAIGPEASGTRALALHRRIDAYTDAHHVVLESRLVDAGLA